MKEINDFDQAGLELTILMPCLNEAETLATCIQKAKASIEKLGIQGEVLIADNGSTDDSIQIATQNGARVIQVTQKGYGNALKAGINNAAGKYIIMGDADDSYDFLHLELFVTKLREGYDLVMGNRFQGGVQKGAMPFLHRYLGNPILSFIGRLFFRIPIGDFHCGLRGLRKERIQSLSLVCDGMEFASEMVVKAAKKNLYICEVPTTLSPDGRSRPPHLRSFRDGWRHLKFLLIYSPRWLFLYPGAFLLGTGLSALILLFQGPIQLFSIKFDIHTMLYASANTIIGLQLVSVAMLIRQLGTKLKLFDSNRFLNVIQETLTIELLLVLGLLAVLAGTLWTLDALSIWKNARFGTLYPSQTMRTVIMSVTLTISGVQIFIYSFFTSVIDFFSSSGVRNVDI
ncbi:MAG: glycosyltransferase family 2 protein [Bdellovibrionales bacterium]|nr:glycosyltransferase family 2 protein [Bdellovibrionales bacterium]